MTREEQIIEFSKLSEEEQLNLAKKMTREEFNKLPEEVQQHLSTLNRMSDDSGFVFEYNPNPKKITDEEFEKLQKERLKQMLRKLKALGYEVSDDYI